MIVRSSHSWFRLLFVWHGSVLPRILPRLMLVLLIALLAASVRHWWLSSFGDSALSIPTFTLLGVSLAIFLGFRNSVSYERFWEARKLWGGLLIINRSIARQLLAAVPRHPLTTQAADLLCAFAYALKAQLRKEHDCEHLLRLVPPGMLDEVQAARFVPAIILRRLGELILQMQREGCITELQWHALDRKLDTMSEILGGCERIDTTPIPYTYRVLLNRTVTIYSLLLPMGLVSSIGWLTPPIAVFIAYTYLALEVIGEELEEPFGREGNDLPLAALCHTIESAVREMQGLPVTVEAPKPQGVYLH
ncbi:probable transmembrane protein [Aquitalea magnusonii]|uniref:Probable transmembrane protein n=1 Tax=Aquitalea magnusonii TaxID=332411 RepID=A0A3G9GC60_9NEIS|nr:bestrophin family ion channel [Aquitalea magnusonii]BBF84319.1 probable transmembrane protein [Aquitalea magnusonii]